MDNFNRSVIPPTSGILYDGGDGSDSLTITGGSFMHEIYQRPPGYQGGGATSISVPTCLVSINPGAGAQP